MKTSSKTVNRRYLGDITVSGHSDTGFGLAVFGDMFMMNKLRNFSKIMMFSYTQSYSLGGSYTIRENFQNHQILKKFKIYHTSSHNLAENHESNEHS